MWIRSSDELATPPERGIFPKINIFCHNDLLTFALQGVNGFLLTTSEVFPACQVSWGLSRSLSGSSAEICRIHITCCVILYLKHKITVSTLFSLNGSLACFPVSPRNSETISERNSPEVLFLSCFRGRFLKLLCLHLTPWGTGALGKHVLNRFEPNQLLQTSPPCPGLQGGAPASQAVTEAMPCLSCMSVFLPAP